MILVGPRQVGKTTLARSFVPAGSANYFDLEDAVVAEQFRAPRALLEGLRLRLRCASRCTTCGSIGFW